MVELKRTFVPNKVVVTEEPISPNDEVLLGDPKPMETYDPAKVSEQVGKAAAKASTPAVVVKPVDPLPPIPELDDNGNPFSDKTMAEMKHGREILLKQNPRLRPKPQ